MPTDINKGFDDGDLLRNIRLDILNPVTVKVKTLETKMGVVEPLAKGAFHTADPDYDNQRIVFHSENGDSTVVLAGMFKEGVDLSIQGETGPAVTPITAIKYRDGKVRRVNGSPTEVSYEWDKIVPANQEKLTIMKVGEGPTYTPKMLAFKGTGVRVVASSTDITTVEFEDPASQILASIPGKGGEFVTPQAITEIELEGETTSSTISNGKLTIHMNTGGGTPLASQNFLGFFDTLGDLISFVTTPVDGKSYAFVKDSKLGGSYYTPYFYVNNSWNELKQDPALTYSSPSDPLTHGVFSIKPSEKIKVDDKGQLDLDGLSTPMEPNYFKGFYNALQDLKNAIPRPINEQDWAYVKGGGGGWMAYRAEMQGSASLWKVVAPLGSIAIVDKKTGPTSFTQGFGIYKDDSWEVDSKGILSLKSMDTTTNVVILDHAGLTTGGKISTIRFENGKSLADVDQSTLTIRNPQRVISYNSEWERGHATQDYRGNIFFDATSRTWMGWSDPEQGGAVGAKWTRIAHADMSLEVKDLVRRVPAKAPDVTPGILNDSALWAHNGVTYLDKDSEHLPEDLKTVCGGYITTSVQDSDAPGVTIPQSRIQTCTADRKEGGTWNRRFISASSPGASTEWSPWIRTSFSYSDIENHMRDPGAHKSCIRFYKATSFSAQYKGFYSQTVEGSFGGVRSENCSLIADNYGSVMENQDFMQTPYDGRFKIKGVLGLAGYADGKNLPVDGQWNVLIRLKHKGESNWTTIGHFRSTKTTVNTKKFPVMGFSTDSIEIRKTDQVIINITHTDSNTLVANHPGLYFVPVRSVFVLEDENTIVGSGIARTFARYIGNTDIMQGVGLRVHHANLTDPKSTVRVYGESMPKEVTQMDRLP